MNTTLQACRATLITPRRLGALAVLMFAMTIPMTRLANGSVDAPQLPPLFVAFGRGVLAGLLALLYLWQVKAPWPPRRSWRYLLGVVMGAMLIFPVCMGLAVRAVPAWHAAVVTGVLPLMTAVLAAWWMGHRPGRVFWWAGISGAALVLIFVQQSAQWDAPGGAWALNDAILLVGMVGGSVAYISGAKASADMPPAHVMSWAVVLALPVTLPAAAWAWQQAQSAGVVGVIQPSAWCGLLYVSVCSSWLGFFAWYAALARDPMGVSQIQLLQPFLSVALSAVVLGEAIHPWAPGFAAAVAACVWFGQRMAFPMAQQTDKNNYFESAASKSRLGD